MATRKKLRIGVGPLSNTIYCGHVIKNGLWGEGKQDVTVEALLSVADHVLRHGKPVVVTENGKPFVRITAEKL